VLRFSLVIRRFLLAVVAYSGSVQASVTLFSSLDPSSTTAHGYFNGATKVADIAQLSSTMGEIEELRLSLEAVNGGSGTGTFQVHFHNLNPGADGFLHTTDDTLGGLIGSWAPQIKTISSNSLLTLTGTPVSVPQTFVWILDKGSDAPSFRVYMTSLESFALGYSNARTAFKNNLPWPAIVVGGPVSIDTSAPYDFNYQVEILSVPEPRPGVLVALFAVSGLVLRRSLRKV